MDRAGVAALIAEIPDYPLPGVSFKDVTPISGNADAVQWVNNEISTRFADSGITQIVGVEARGFILGASLATHMHLGFVPSCWKCKACIDGISLSRIDRCWECDICSSK